MTRFDPDALSSWLREHGRSAARVQPLTGDVSARRYARAHLDDGQTAIVAYYPDELLDACRRFELSTAMLLRAGVAVPRILAVDCDLGLMLVEDAGEETLFERPDDQPERIEVALETAARIAALDPAEVAKLNPRLDGPHLRRELQQTLDAFLEPSRLSGNDTLHGEVGAGFDRLCAALDDAPAAPCHRDFMVRNLIPTTSGQLVVLDHQDLRLGPPSYDLASLLNDSFYPSPELEARWLTPYLADGAAELDYHRAAAQRTLKAVGTFAAFAARGFERHLPLIPPTLERALHHLALAPEVAQLAPELERIWRPWIDSQEPSVRSGG